MMNADDCLRAAWAALSRGDLAERDRCCDLAKNMIEAGKRARMGGAVVEGEPIALPDRSHERIQ